MLYIYATALANIGLHHLWVPEVFHQVLTREGGQRAQYMIKKIHNIKVITLRGAYSLVGKTDVFASHAGAQGAHGSPAIRAQATFKYPLIRTIDTHKKNNGSIIISNVFVEAQSLQGHKNSQ